jgi:hypothetical protein
METIIPMVVAALTPMGKDYAAKTGFDAGEKLRDLIAESENELDDTAVEIAEVFVTNLLEGLNTPAE